MSAKKVIAPEQQANTVRQDLMLLSLMDAVAAFRDTHDEIEAQEICTLYEFVQTNAAVIQLAYDARVAAIH